MGFTPTPPPGSYAGGSGAAAAAASAPSLSSSSSDRVILRIGGRKPSAELSRPTSSSAYQPAQAAAQAVPPSQPPTYAAYSRPTSAHSGAAANPSASAANEIVYTIRPNTGRSSASSISARGNGVPVHSGYVAPAAASASSSSSGSNLARSSSAASLPLAVAIGSDSFIGGVLPSDIASSAQSGGGSGSSSVVAVAGTGAPSASSSSSSGQVIPVPSLRSPGSSIGVPLIRISSLAPQAAQAETARLKSDFHTSVRDFFSQAKRNIDQLAAELFYEEENDEDDEDEDEEGAGDEAEPAGSEGQKRLTAGGNASATPEKTKASALRLTSGNSADSTGAVTPALLSSASQRQLGSPRKTQLLQQLMSLSAHMDEGLSAVSKAKEAAARAAKEASAASTRSGGGGGGGGGALSYDTRSHANKFNKLDIQALAAMAREDDVASPRKGAAGPGSKGAYPEVSDQTKRTLAEFVRRSQLPDRARAYELWVSNKEAAQTKALARAEQKAKEARLAELRAARMQRAHEAAQSAERERARLEEEALAQEIESQRAAQAAEESARLAEERAERARLEEERREREAARRAEREEHEARQRLEQEMAARAAEQRAWEEEKRAKELQENEALRLTEELKKQVARDLALVTTLGAARGAGGSDDAAGQSELDAHDRRDQAELDALFAQAQRDTDEHMCGGGGRGRQEEGPDTDEEFGEFGEEEGEEQGAPAPAPASLRPPLPPGSRTVPTSGASASQGRKGRTVAAAAAAPFQMPAFPTAPSLPPSASPPALTARERAAAKAMLFGAPPGAQTNVAPSTNYRFERAKRMHGR